MIKMAVLQESIHSSLSWRLKIFHLSWMTICTLTSKRSKNWIFLIKILQWTCLFHCQNLSKPPKAWLILLQICSNRVTHWSFWQIVCTTFILCMTLISLCSIKLFKSPEWRKKQYKIQHMSQSNVILITLSVRWILLTLKYRFWFVCNC